MMQMLQPPFIPLDPMPEQTKGRMKFTPEEDQLLKQLVDLSNGNPNWSMIAKQIGNGRNQRQCRERFKNYLSPKLQNGPWTQEEEQLLEEKFNEIGPKWSRMTVFFAGRSDVNLKNHWVSILNRKSKEEFEKRKMNEQGKVDTPPQAAEPIPPLESVPLLQPPPALSTQQPVQPKVSVPVFQNDAPLPQKPSLIRFDFSRRQSRVTFIPDVSVDQQYEFDLGADFDPNDLGFTFNTETTNDLQTAFMADDENPFGF